MRKLILIACFIIPIALIAQNRPEIRLVDARTGEPVAGATVIIDKKLTVNAGESGEFSIAAASPGIHFIRVTAVGYLPFQDSINFQNTAQTIKLAEGALFLQPVEIRALRAGDKAPFTKTNLSKREIEQNNLGQDIPFILNQTPSVVVNSDAGNGVGYTRIYIRGTDATRINMTLNGIPYNDAEDQSIYFVDLPDFASSVNSIQIQRGVGTSSNGAGAFGATINFSTNEFNEHAYAEINNSYGSFNTWKNTIKAGSGLINDHFSLDIRLSRITSDGYIDRASSNLKSFFISAAYYAKNTSIHFNIISGNEKTYQAWNGIPEAKLNGNRLALDEHYQNNIGSLYFTAADSLNLYNSNRRTYNYFTYKNQTDNYLQNHYQLLFDQRVNNNISLNAAAFFSRGLGYYEEYKPQSSYADYNLPPIVSGPDTVTQTDLVRQLWLDNYFFGGIYSAQYKSANTDLTIGGGWDRYNGGHYGIVNWAANGGVPIDYKWYDVRAYKTDFNIYSKLRQRLGERWTAFADLQYRSLFYHIGGFQDNPGLVVDKSYRFINPKAGITYSHHDFTAYFSYALANHEPNRDDFESAQDQQPKPEKLHDFEFSAERKNSNYSWNLTGFYMLYSNQLALNGKINSVGEYTRVNIPSSYRLGVELQGSIRINEWLNANGNFSLSRNKVKDYKEYIDDYDDGSQKTFSYHETNIAFSPSVVSGYSVNITAVKNGTISWIGKYVGSAYLDNTQHQDRKLDPYYVQNLRLAYLIRSKTIKETNLIFQVNNLFNEKYAPNGYTYSYYSNKLITENFLFPMAVTNFMFAVNFKL